MRENWCEKQNTRYAHIFQYPRHNQPHHRYSTAIAEPIGAKERATTPHWTNDAHTRHRETRAHNLMVDPAPHGGNAPILPPLRHHRSNRHHSATPRATTSEAPCPNYSVPFCYSIFKGCNKVNSQSEERLEPTHWTIPPYLQKRTRILF